MKTIVIVSFVAIAAGCATSPEPHRLCRDGQRAYHGEQHESAVTRLTASQFARALRVKVSVTGEDAKSAVDVKLAESITPIIRNSLYDAGFEVVLDGDSEVVVAGTARCFGGSSRGSRTMCRGMVELNFLRSDGRNDVTDGNIRWFAGNRRFEAKSPEAISPEEALVSLGGEFAAPIGRWVRDAGARLAGNLSVCEIAIRSSDGRTPIEIGYPTGFVKVVQAIKGVYWCRILPIEGAGTSMKAAILYEPSQIPEGMLNRLMSIKSLKIER